MRGRRGISINVTQTAEVMPRRQYDASEKTHQPRLLPGEPVGEASGHTARLRSVR
jgi:hypothetical protein